MMQMRRDMQLGDYETLDHLLEKLQLHLLYFSPCGSLSFLRRLQIKITSTSNQLK